MRSVVYRSKKCCWLFFFLLDSSSSVISMVYSTELKMFLSDGIQFELTIYSIRYSYLFFFFLSDLPSFPRINSRANNILSLLLLLLNTVNCVRTYLRRKSISRKGPFFFLENLEQSSEEFGDFLITVKKNKKKRRIRLTFYLEKKN